MIAQSDIETLSLKEIDALPNGERKAIAFAGSGLFFDGGHHKQWFLEEILKALGVDVEALDDEWSQDEEYGSWERGIAP